jgi:hypothetical protein
MSLKKYQRYYFRALFKNYEASDKFTAIDKFGGFSKMPFNFCQRISFS